jgi:signal transduction histidine kinase
VYRSTASRKEFSALPTQPEHIVQFYERSEALLDNAARFLSTGLAGGESVVVIANERHRHPLEARLGSEPGFEEARKSGRYVSFDAAETLSRFCAGEVVSGLRFAELASEILNRAVSASRERRVRVFGEMVSVLVSDGRREAALRLERLWNDLAQVIPFALLCAYPIGGFDSESDGAVFLQTCDQHSHVIPAETYTGLIRLDERHRAIAELQQKAKALEAEVARRKRIEKALRARERALSEGDRRKNEFLAILGHELRNPLSPIVTTLDLLQRKRDPETLERAIGVMERQARHLTRLVDDLLDVSRITRGQIALREETLDLAAIVHRAIEQARPAIEERGHRFDLDLPRAPVTLSADPVRLEQILVNLLINAAKYTERGGCIEMSARPQGGELVICVRDDGVGMTAEVRKRIFDPFVQTPATPGRASGGLGIGLTLVKRLVELHGGSVEARSDGPGRGSEFVVRLPGRLRGAGEAGRDVSSARAEAPASAASRRVLVVDDNADLADGLAALLRSLGHDVAIARDGVEAIPAAEELHPEVVFLDISLPGIDGLEVARRLRSLPDLRPLLLVAMTGYGLESDRLLSREAGFDHHLVKPVNAARIQNLLRDSA